MEYKNILELVAKETGLQVAEIDRMYKSYWEFIRKTIEKLPLSENIGKEEFEVMRTSFNIPSLGKLHCSYDRMLGVKKRYRLLKERNRL